VERIGALHPALAHFPIALLIAALPAELLARIRKSEGMAVAGRYCVLLGAVSAVLTTLVGFAWAGFGSPDDPWDTLAQHRLTGLGTALLAVWLLVLCYVGTKPDAKGARTAYLVSLVLTAVLVGLTGFLGGAMVWGTDHLRLW